MKLNQKIVRRVALSVVPAIAFVVHACTQPLSLEDVLVRPTSMAAVGSSSFSATAGAVVQNPATVVVKDQESAVIGNQVVNFVANRGTLSAATATTNAQGEATPASWTAPTQSGPATITASLSGFSVPPVTFTVTVNAGAPQTQTKTANTDNQSAIAGAAVANAPEITVMDQYQNGISGIAVTFTILTGGGTINGSLSTLSVNTDANGKAKPTSWVLGTAVGSNTLRATTAVLPGQPLTFTATGTVGPVNKIVIAPPGNSQSQSAVGGTNVAVAPSVLVTDANNNPITSVVARFTVSAGGGKVLANASDATGSTFLDATTNASGIATIFGWRLGVKNTSTDATQTISVTIPSASGVAAFAINATATAGAATTIAIVTETPSSNNQTAIVNANVAVAPGAVLKDAQGNVVASTSVTFTVGASSGTIKLTSAGSDVVAGAVTTDANGIARVFSWKLGNRGANTLTAALTSNSAINVVFSATGIAGPPASIEIAAGNNQTTIANTATPIAPSVLVKDANGLTVDAGANIAFSITNGGGIVSATGCTGAATTATVATIADGTATVGCWKPGTVGSTNTLRATVVGSPTIFVTFLATGTVGPASSIAFTNQPWPYTQVTTTNGGVPKVTVTDVGGNFVSGVTVNWSSPNSNSTVGGTLTSVTNASGVAQFQGGQGGTWTAANVPSGSLMTLTASVTSPSLSTSVIDTVVGAPSAIIAAVNAPSTTVVNAVVSPTPVASVRDAQNRPVPKSTVSWAITVNPGGTSTATLTGSSTLTDSVGNATAGSWKVASNAGANTIQASIPSPATSVNLSTTGVAGPAANIGVNLGNSQTALASTAVATPPSVVVRDAFGNLAGAGVSVTFQPTSGSGSVTGSPATTNSSSIATVGSWTLGATPGSQTLNAFLTTNSSVTTAFTATALDPCDNGSTAYTIGSATVNGTLASTDCNLTHTSGTGTVYGDVYRITVPASTTRYFRVQLNAAGFGPQLRAYAPFTIGSYWYNSSSTPANISSYYVFGPGTHDIVATSDAVTTTGAYSFNSDLNPAVPTGCGNFVVTKNITIATHTLVTSNCTYTYNTGTSAVASRRYLLYLPSGQSATVNVSGATVDWYLEAYDISGGGNTFLTFADAGSGGGAETLTITSSASTNRFIEIRVAHWQTSPPAAGTYPYTLTIP